MSHDLLFAVKRRAVAQRAVQPLPVVEDLDVVEDRQPRLLQCFERFIHLHLSLERGPRQFHCRVVVAVALGAHARDGVVAGEQASEPFARILAPSVRVEEYSPVRPVSENRLKESVGNQVCPHRVPQAPAFDAAGSEILDGGGIASALAGGGMRVMSDNHTGNY